MGFIELFGLISSLFSRLSGIFFGFLISMFNFVQAITLFLLDVIGIEARGANTSFNNLRVFSGAFWGGLLRKLWANILILYAKIRDRLERILGPILRVIQRIRRWLDEHIYPSIRRYLDLIQRMRRVLVIFRIFNIKWAKALDARLAKKEAEVARGFTLVRGKLNEIASLLNVLLDIDLILRAEPFVKSLGNAAGYIADLMHQLGLRPLPSADEDAIRTAQVRVTIDGTVEHMRAQAGSSPTAEDTALREMVRKEIAEAAGLALDTLPPL